VIASLGAEGGLRPGLGGGTAGSSEEPDRAEGGPSGAEAGTAAGPRWVGWLAVGAVAVAPLVEAVRIVIQRGHVVLDGDEALLELGARRAAHLDQLVGPYSRVGFHEPGPVLFYLLAPFAWVLGPSGPGLFLGAIAISGAALIAIVVVLWRLAGPGVALWAALSIDVFCLCVRIGTLREPWNPYLVVAPMVLFVVLWAAGVARGSSPAAVWALVIGSYEIQTHIATAGFVVAMSAVLGASMVVRVRRGRQAFAPRRRRLPVLLAAAMLTLEWVAPVVELWRDHPNNLMLLWDYFGSGPATPTWGQTVKVAANAITIMPFGYRDYSLALTRTGVELAVGIGLIVLGLAIAVTLGIRRRQPLSLALAASAVLGAVIGVISLSRASTPLFLYFAVWLSFVPLSVLLAIGVALFAPAPPAILPSGPIRTATRWRLAPSRRIIPVLVVAASLIAAVAVRSDLGMASVTTSSGAGPWPEATDGSPAARASAISDTAALTAAAEKVLRPTDRWVGFTLGPASPWPYVAGMVLGLDERGVQSTVAPASWELYFGHERAPGRAVKVEFGVFAAPAKPAFGRVIADIGGAVLTYERIASHGARPPVR
jgi:hypothetical protein